MGSQQNARLIFMSQPRKLREKFLFIMTKWKQITTVFILRPGWSKQYQRTCQRKPHFLTNFYIASLWAHQDVSAGVASDCNFIVSKPKSLNVKLPAQWRRNPGFIIAVLQSKIVCIKAFIGNSVPDIEEL